MSILEKLLNLIRGAAPSSSAALQNGPVSTEEAARQKIKKVVEFVSANRVCENAAYIINETSVTELNGIKIERIKGNDERAKAFAQKVWPKVDSLTRIKSEQGKLVELVVMELRNWSESDRNTSESGEFYIYFGGDKVFESNCTRYVANEAYDRKISIDGSETFIKAFTNGEWVDLLANTVSESKALQEKWKRDYENREREKLLKRANDMRI